MAQLNLEEWGKFIVHEILSRTIIPGKGLSADMIPGKGTIVNAIEEGGGGGGSDIRWALVTQAGNLSFTADIYNSFKLTGGTLDFTDQTPVADAETVYVINATLDPTGVTGGLFSVNQVIAVVKATIEGVGTGWVVLPHAGIL